MIKNLMLSLLAATLAVGLANAGDKGTPEQAKLLVEEAVAYLNTRGTEETLAEINKRDGMFVKEDVYVFAYDMVGVPSSVRGRRPKLAGPGLVPATRRRRSGRPGSGS